MDKYLVKICGVRDVETAVGCAELGVDLIGLNFVAESKRRVDEETAKEICEAVGRGSTEDRVSTGLAAGRGSKAPKKVGVFRNHELAEVNRIAREVGLDYVQLHGDEDWKFVASCERPVIKGVIVFDNADLERARKFVAKVEYLLLDGPDPGSGETFDWSLVEEFPRKFLVAGGIDGKNVVEVIRRLNPIGVDVASGVESDGRVDLEKVEELVAKVRSEETM